jgi:integrase
MGKRWTRELELSAWLSVININWTIEHFVNIAKIPSRPGLALVYALYPHPHMLGRACGFALADQGADTRLIQDYPGHRTIQHTVIYTAANPARFERLWR